MKALLRMMVAVCSSAACLSGAHADVFSTGFESDAVGSYPSGFVVQFGGASQSVVSAPAHTGLRAFQQTAAPFGAAESYVPLAPVSGRWTLEFSMRLDEASTAADHGDLFVRYESPDWSVGAALSRPMSAGGAWVFSFGGGPAVPSLVATPGEWYDVRCRYDPVTMTSKYWINGRLVATNVANVPSGHSDRIAVHVGNIDDGMLRGQFDDIALVPTPASLAPLAGVLMMTRRRRS